MITARGDVMRRADEDAVLSLAVEKGLIRKSDLVRLGLLAAQEKTLRIELLSRELRLSAEALSELVAEARRRAPESTSLEVSGDGPTRPMMVAYGAASDISFLPPDWDRYRIEDFLGAGGMGSVYKAFDPRLERVVALKFVHATDPRSVERFRREAMAQAAVVHENLCQIFEIGEVAGRPYLAMQYVHGRPLIDVAPAMSLEEKVRCVADVADAVHEAHAAGLIHRDIKPGNIMIEERASVGTPILMDFGLARQASHPGLTVTGSLLGTPSYMSPEQARGEVSGLDNRTDVYGLGATLYAILAGRPLFEGEDLVEIIGRVQAELPPRLRASRPEIPADVESIVMKCLRKDPAERYPSARELAADLRRHLEGMPVTARPMSVAYRWKLKLAHHRWATRTAAVGAALLAVALAWGLRERWTASRSAAVAASFGQQVERIDSIARIASMAPLHDVRPERERIRAAMNEIRSRMEKIGPPARGTGNYALGRGLLALEEWDAARDHLRAGWEEGYREPGAAYALGLVLGELYRRELAEIAQIPKGEDRDAARRKVESEYRDAALEFLRQSAGVEIEAPEYVEALLAHLEGRNEDALTLAREAYADRPWFYEARELEGEIRAARGDEQAARGEYEEANAEYGAAWTAFEEALAVGASDLGVLERMVRLAHTRMIFEIEGPGKDVGPWYRDGMRVVEMGHVADPGYAPLRVLEAWLHQRRAEFQAMRGEDPQESYDAAIASARSALAGGRGDAAAHAVLGSTHRKIAEYLRSRGQDPRPRFEEAIRAYDAANRLRPDYDNRANVGLLRKSLALDRMNRGEDPVPDLERSVQAYRQALALDPDRISARHNLGVTYYTWAKHLLDRGEDPRETLASAIESFEGVLQLNPIHLATLYNAGRAYRRLGTYRASLGEDPRDDLGGALASLAKAVERHPESVYLPHLYDGMGKVWVALAEHDLSRGIDASEKLDRAVAAYREALAKNPKFVPPHVNLSTLHALRASHELAVGRDPSRSVELALASSEEALRLTPDDAGARTTRGDALYLRAKHEVSEGRDPAESLTAARRDYHAALAANPSFTPAHYGLGLVAALQGSRAAARGEEPRAALDDAERSFRRALELDPHLAGARVEWARVCLERAQWSSTRAESVEVHVAAGVEQVERALSRNPELAEALALRGALRFALAGATIEDPHGALAEAARDLASALSRNPHLEREYGPLRREAAERSSSIARSGP
jgi:serine/threonine-protein kinase